MSEQLQQIPDGVYRGTCWIDSDGIDGLNIPVVATVTVAGDQVKVELTPYDLTKGRISYRAR